MNRRTMLAATLAGALLLAGCGVPDSTEVQVDGSMSEADSTGADEAVHHPPTPDEADDQTQLVEHFLQAATANLENPVEPLSAFVHRDQQSTWQPDPQILLVRTDDPVPTQAGDVVRVQVDGRVIGVLGEGGIVEPRDETKRLTFEVGVEPEAQPDEDPVLNVGQPRYRLVNPPDEIWLSTSAMVEEYLRPHPVYFWDQEQRALVPDLRWLPSTLLERQRAQRSLEWLEDGPAPWLQGAVSELDDDVALAGNVVENEDRIDVPLTAAAGEVDDPGNLDAQLWWTLRPFLSTPPNSSGRALVVNIDGETREIGEEYLTRNPTVRRPPARFAVLDGVIHQQRYTGDNLLDVPALAGDVNANIHSAAITPDHGSAALVKVEPDERLRLVVSGPDGAVETDLVVGDMGRPVWLHPGDTGLVAADGKLYRFQADGQESEVDVPGLTGIEAVAADASGRRLALVAGGNLYVASMVRRDGSVSVNQPRPLATTAENLSGVAFLQESWLAIVGEAEGQTKLFELTVDGAYERELPNGTVGVVPGVDSFVAYPGDPRDRVASRGEIMYETEGRAYTYSLSFRPVQLQATDLYGDVSEEDAGDPRAPFFLD
jgi:hypothetical protein